VDNKNGIKTIGGLILAGLVGLGAAFGHGAAGGLFKAGRGVGKIAEAIPKSSEARVPLLSAAGHANVTASGNNVSAPRTPVLPAEIAQNSTNLDTPEEAVKEIPGAVVVAHRWIVARMKISAEVDSKFVCMALTKEKNHALFFYAASSIPVYFGIGSFGKDLNQLELATSISISFDGKTSTELLHGEHAATDGMKMKIFLNSEQKYAVLKSMQFAQYITISTNDESWSMDLSGSNKAIIALFDCAKRT
jgi:hypothetical protein